MKRYIYSKKNELLIIALILLLFLIVFYLFDFMFRAYLLSVSIIIIIYVIYFITHFFTFIDEENKTKQIEILEKQIQQLKNKQSSYQEEIESYSHILEIINKVSLHGVVTCIELPRNLTHFTA